MLLVHLSVSMKMDVGRRAALTANQPMMVHVSVGEAGYQVTIPCTA